MHRHRYNQIREDSLAGRKLRPPEAAAFLGMSTSTLAKWRVYGRGPPFSRLSRGLVVYDERDLEAFVAERRRLSTSDDR
ncbi:Transcriptional regulator (fragment) [uncultured Defluviicoccus sp.]|uniref:Transcriptional regulator n=1 Tax=metagenome TaxID=256318 RepID=A0A380TD81_9ZZZZ